MRTVLQSEAEPDCGAACVAMLLGCSLSTARKKLYGKAKVKTTKTADLRRVLSQRLPVATGKPLPEEGLKSLGKHALVFGVLADGRKHWVVWDAKQKCLRDPQGISQSFRIMSHLPVGRLIK